MRKNNMKFILGLAFVASCFSGLLAMEKKKPNDKILKEKIHQYLQKAEANNEIVRGLLYETDFELFMKDIGCAYWNEKEMFRCLKANCNRRAEDDMMVLDSTICYVNNDVSRVELLLLAGAKINGNAHSGRPLMGAVRRSSEKIVQLLLDYGADSNIKSSRGETALDIARKKGNQKIVNLLQGRKS